ncbi:hypothetical protein CEXT_86721 [Caerostris extrusa]|uniref:Uncharacterized protein n=1 Tax=Caerostris extrusa TaxID=172846 RepID=A0AAV4XES6_CAEEX|nr:hypothetical protein CEXT_86721 [Caerostris extrusa]
MMVPQRELAVSCPVQTSPGPKFMKLKFNYSNFITHILCRKKKTWNKTSTEPQSRRDRLLRFFRIHQKYESPPSERPIV